MIMLILRSRAFILTSFLLLMSCVVARSATPDTISKSIPLVWATFDVGKIVQTNDHLKGLNKSGAPFERYKAYSLGVAWRTSGNKDWHHVNNFPSFGFGIYTAKLDGDDELGQPISLFGTLKGVIARLGSNTIGYNVDYGVAFHWTPYDYNSNSYNITIGSKASAHLGLGVNYSYTIANRVELGVDAGFTHFSNGAIRKPNKGLNLMHVSAHVAYLLNQQRPIVRKFFEKQKSNNIDFTVGFGLKSSEVDSAETGFNRTYYDNIRFHVATLQAAFLHQYCQRGKYGAGLSLVYDDFYDSTILPVCEGDGARVVHGNFSKRFSLGVFAEHIFMVGPLSFPTQLGYYIYQPNVSKSQKKNSLFQRAGVRYTLPFDAYFGVNIYAHRLSKADFIEWNLGYNLKLKKH
ncbi:MAG: acyloxyacyl hydrolase [Marinilabiliaceae bacterium]|nr:acyloxyacyl hydrolase [Marinilabiliaceae bacterium]